MPGLSLRATPLGTLGEGVVRLLYPPVCAGCGALVARAADPLCPLCLSGLERADAAELQAFLAQDGHPPDACALWRFDRGGAFQAVHHALKYDGRSRYGVRMGAWVAEALGARLGGTLVPVPLHRRRLLERGYNQSALIARGIAESTGLPVEEGWLRRTHYARTQTRLGRQSRAANAEAAFAVSEGAPVAGTDVTVVDDIVTTGATLHAAAQALRAAGARHVCFVAVAWAR